jgi:hypothetical protein
MIYAHIELTVDLSHGIRAGYGLSRMGLTMMNPMSFVKFCAL